MLAAKSTFSMWQTSDQALLCSCAAVEAEYKLMREIEHPNGVRAVDFHAVEQRGRLPESIVRPASSDAFCLVGKGRHLLALHMLHASPSRAAEVRAWRKTFCSESNVQI
eukprot:3928752-Amphidinium_carterae.1